MQNKPKIDEKDTKILRSLLRDSRTSFTEMAKDCKVSVNAVKARYEMLKREGVIVGEIMQVNPRAIGFNSVADLSISTAVEDEKEILKFLKSKPYIASYTNGFWKFNIGAIAVLTDIEKLASFHEELESNPLIKEITTQIWVEPINMDHTENLVISNFENSKKETEKRGPSAVSANAKQIDETDREIAKILTRNARIPFKQIGEQLNISTKKVIQRYEKLRGNLLTISTITVDLKKLGYNAVSDILIKAKKRNEIPKIHAQILEIPNVIVTIRVMGPYDMRVIVALKDFEDMFKLRQEIGKIKHIDQADIYVHEAFREWPLNLFTSLL